MLRHRLSLAIYVLADLWLLLRFRPQWQRLQVDLSSPRPWLAKAGTNEAALTLAEAVLWLAAIWLALGLAATAAGMLPGKVGALSRRVATNLVPLAVHRLVAGAAGAPVLLSPVVAVAAPASPLDVRGRTTSSTVGWALDAPAGSADSADSGPSIDAPALGWPLGGASAISKIASPVAPSDRSQVASPSVSTVSASSRPPTVPKVAPRTMPSASLTKPNAGATVQPASPTNDGRSPHHGVTPNEKTLVRPGDSLWVIAAQRLGTRATDREISREWPRWYEANRSTVGADPNLLSPGEQLIAPEAN